MLDLVEEENQIFNLGSGQDNSINEFVKIVCSNYDYDFNLFEYDLKKYVGVKEKKIDTSKTTKFLQNNKFLKTSLNKGIAEATQYFIKKREENNYE